MGDCQPMDFLVLDPHITMVTMWIVVVVWVVRVFSRLRH